MQTDTTQPTTTGTLRIPDAELHYEIRGDGPLIALVGCPMDASAFAPLADLLAAEYTVVTTDPRGIRHSRVADPDLDVSPETLASDLSQLIGHLGVGPAVVFGSSGGAVTALALALEVIPRTLAQNCLLLRCASGHHARVVGQKHERQMERVGDRDEVRCLLGGVGRN